jgi:hypothetical protein
VSLKIQFGAFISKLQKYNVHVFINGQKIQTLCLFLGAVPRFWGGGARQAFFEQASDSRDFLNAHACPSKNVLNCEENFPCTDSDCLMLASASTGLLY